MITLEKILSTDLIQDAFVERSGIDRDWGQQVQQYREIADEMIQDGFPLSYTVALVWSPGRIEVLGKHTDYAGGVSLLTALDRGFALVAARNESTIIDIKDVSTGQQIYCAVSDLSIKGGHKWGAYAEILLKRLRLNFGSFSQGCTLYFQSNLPSSAGMSSSSALVISLFLGLRGVYGLHTRESYRTALTSPLEMAEYLGYVENGSTYKTLVGERGVGTKGGSQDHIAILCSKSNTLSLFSFLPARFEGEVDIPVGYCFCIASSGVQATKTSNVLEMYNQSAWLVHEALAWCNRQMGFTCSTLGELTTLVSFEEIETCLQSHAKGEALIDRVRHFQQEVYHIIPYAFEALKEGNLEAFGAYVDRSVAMGDVYLHNQIKETLSLAQFARDLRAVASSPFGAGFGGAVWALVPEDYSPEFLASWQHRYHDAYPSLNGRASFFRAPSGPGGFCLPE